jgi:hypothetical protein
MAEAAANPLIMALRANTTPSGSMPGAMQFFSFPWQKNGSALVTQPRTARTAPPPPPPIVDPPVPPPVVPPPSPPAPPPSPPVLPPVMPPRNDRETRPTLDTPVYIPDAVDISIDPPVFAFEKTPDVSISYEELVDPNPFNVNAPPADAVKLEPEVAITYEELVDPNPWNVNAPPAEIAQQQDPEVAVSVEEIPDNEPSTLRDMLSALIPQSAPADMAEPEPDVEVTIEEVPDAPVPVTQEVPQEPSVPPALRDMLEALIPAVPVTSPVPDPEPEGTVTVEEVPDVPVASSGRPAGGYAIDTGLARELMMMAALANMVGPTDPVGQITIEELGDFGY